MYTIYMCIIYIYVHMHTTCMGATSMYIIYIYHTYTHITNDINGSHVFQ